MLKLLNNQIQEWEPTFLELSSYESVSTKTPPLHILQRKNKMRIEGHRGAGLMEPENTLKAFKKAIELGLDGIELDIWLTKDGIPAVVHGKSDDNIEFAGLLEKMENITSEELRKLKLVNGESVPLLCDVLELCKGNICINIELKGQNLSIVEPIVFLVEKYQMWNQINFSSFHHTYYEEILRVMKIANLNQRAYFGYLLKREQPAPDLVNAEENDSLNLDYQLFLQNKGNALDLIQQAQLKKMKIKVYFPMKIKEHDEMYEELLTMEIDTIITNYPQEILTYMETIKPKENLNTHCSRLSQHHSKSLGTEIVSGKNRQ